MGDNTSKELPKLVVFDVDQTMVDCSIISKCDYVTQQTNMLTNYKNNVKKDKILVCKDKPFICMNGLCDMFKTVRLKINRSLYKQSNDNIILTKIEDFPITQSSKDQNNSTTTDTITTTVHHYENTKNNYDVHNNDNESLEDMSITDDTGIYCPKCRIFHDYHYDDEIYDYIHETPKYIIKVSIRPHVHDFIRKLVQMKVDVAIFSLGAQEYIEDLVSSIFNDIPWKFVWSRENCADNNKTLTLITQKYPQYVKNDIVLIDDLIINCYNNSKDGYKCILVPAYSFDKQENDFVFNESIMFKRLETLMKISDNLLRVFV